MVGEWYLQELAVSVWVSDQRLLISGQRFTFDSEWVTRGCGVGRQPDTIVSGYMLSVSRRVASAGWVVRHRGAALDKRFEFVQAEVIVIQVQVTPQSRQHVLGGVDGTGP